MDLFKMSTHVQSFDAFEHFLKQYEITDKDLILTHGFLYDPFMKPHDLKAKIVIQEAYGSGEPTDTMINAILNDIDTEAFERIFAIGGGTVIDIAKLFVLKDLKNVQDAFEKTMPLIKNKTLIVLPTTCGTGSEVTNITIAMMTQKGTKMGLAIPELMPDFAVLIPELLKSLPLPFFLYSSIDALIHASEAYLSPKATPYTDVFCENAVKDILTIYKRMVEKGSETRFEYLKEMLIASNYAGIAFGNAGVGAVHALSYPLGGTYHVPHGEANYQFFIAVFKKYQDKHPQGKIAKLNQLIAEQLGVGTDNAFEALETLLSELIAKKPLKNYGMAHYEIDVFSQSVIETQQRLLGNNYVPIDIEEIRTLYTQLF